MNTDQVSNIAGQANPADVPQFNWRQLATFVILPIVWWFILLYVVTPILLPAFSMPNGEPNAWLFLSIATLGYLFEFCLALFIFHKEGYPLRWSSLKERIHWRWPRGWKSWAGVLALFVVAFGVSMLLDPINKVTTAAMPPPDWFPASQNPLKEVNSLAEALPGVTFAGNYLFLLLVLFSGTMNIVGEDLYYRGALIPKLNGLFGKWDWVVGGIIWPLKHVYVWWRASPQLALGLAGAFAFGPMGSLPVAMIFHFIPNHGFTWPAIFQAVFGG